MTTNNGSGIVNTHVRPVTDAPYASYVADTYNAPLSVADGWLDGLIDQDDETSMLDASNALDSKEWLFGACPVCGDGKLTEQARLLLTALGQSACPVCQGTGCLAGQYLRAKGKSAVVTDTTKRGPGRPRGSVNGTTTANGETVTRVRNARVAHPSGLNAGSLAILRALRSSPVPLTREGIMLACGGNYYGPDRRALVDNGYINALKYEGDKVLTFVLTNAGEDALAHDE